MAYGSVRSGAIAVGVMVVGAASVLAANVPVVGRSVSIKTNNTTSKYALKSTQKDAAVVFGGAGSPAMLSGTLEVYYADTPANLGTLSMPAPWLSNTGAVIKFKNALAPLGPTPVKTASVKVASTAKVAAKGLGGLNITAPPGANGIVTILTINNAATSTVTRLCTQYAVGLGSVVTHKATGTGNRLTAKRGVGIPCPPSCNDTVKNGSESDVDCGGSCADCGTGKMCNSASDCQSGVCSGGICQAPTCFDGVKNGPETGVDCGGGCTGCSAGGACNVGPDCASGACVSGVCKCQNHAFTFTVSSNSGGVFDSAEWPGGTTSQTFTSGCNVTINRPNDNIDLVCTLAAPFSVNSFSGYSNCFGNGGEDGDGCNPLSCPPAGIGSCCSGRPSCSAALNGSGSAQYFVQCLQ